MKLFKNRSTIFLLLTFIVIIAAVLRFYQLGKVPVSLYWDEVSSAYNAYSIGETLRDEHGHFLPILFQAFGDYKMPGMIYIMAMSIKILGLNEFAVRFPEAFFGVLMVIATYFLVNELLQCGSVSLFFPQEKKKGIIESISLLSAFLLAISPWHLQFSRTGFEAGIAIVFITYGMLCFLLSLRKPWLLIVSSILFGLSFYFYRSVFVFLPVFLIIVFLIFREEIFTKISYKIIIISSIVFILLSVPIWYKVFTPPGFSRANDVSIFTNSGDTVALNEMWAIESGYGYLGNIFYNKRFVYLKELLNNYSDNISVPFLFTNGDANPRHSTRDMGVMYLWELPFILLGMYALLMHFSRKIKLTIFAWFFVGPLPAAISIPNPHALRSLNILPSPQIIVAIGLVYGFFLVRRYTKILRPVYIAAIAVVMIFFLVSYLFNYYTTSTFLAADDWGDGYKQMNEFVLRHQNNYGKILISGHDWEPYIYTLFYSKYSPSLYQTNGTPQQFGKYIFGGTSWVTDGLPELGNDNLYLLSQGEKTLVVLAPSEYDKQKAHIHLLKKIQDVGHKTVFLIGDLLPQNK